MRKKYFYALMMAGGIIAASTSTVITYTSGPPVNNAGAPTGGDCTGCHSGTVNSGTGTSSIVFSGSTQYLPGQTYTVTASILEPGRSKFGFQIVALKNSDNLEAGSWIITNATTTKGVSSVDATFIEHTSAGTAQMMPGLGSWSIDWVAPSSNVGSITFYLATNATNSDGLSSGDNIYTKTLTIAAVVCTTNMFSIVNNVNNVTCFGLSNGSASVNVSGGTSPYTYKWSNSAAQTDSLATGLSAGNYTVTIADSKGCDSIFSVSISQPLAISIFTSKSDATCGSNDGTAYASASGGVPSYSYLWSTGSTSQTITGLSGGTYNITVVDANGCSMVSTVNVNDIGAPNAVVSYKNNVSCNGGSDGSAKASVIGGTSPYTLSWSTLPVQTKWLATGLSADIYNFTLTDSNGCVSIVSVTITEPPALVSLLNPVSVSCKGACDGIASLSALGGGTSPYAYLWSNGNTSLSINNLCPGIYSVTITDANGCLKVDSASVIEPDSITLKIFTTNESISRDDGTASVSASGGTIPYTYSWSNGSTDSLITGLTSGFYIVTVSDANGCMSIIADSVGFDVGIGFDSQKNNFINMYPNPVNTILTISIENQNHGELVINIYNILGNLIFSQNLTQTQETHYIDFEQLGCREGMYFIHLQTQNYVEVRKVVLSN